MYRTKQKENETNMVKRINGRINGLNLLLAGFGFSTSTHTPAVSTQRGGCRLFRKVPEGNPFVWRGARK